jgi:phosphate acetyltransferase
MPIAYISHDEQRLDSTGKELIIVKENIHSDEFLKHIMKNFNKDKNFLSHVFVMEKDDNQFIITDCVLNIKPSLKDKEKILQNAIDFADKYFICTNVAVISPSGEVNPKIQSSLDYLYLKEIFDVNTSIELCQLDTALSRDARWIKNKEFYLEEDAVPDDLIMPNVLLVDNLGEGNILYKALMLNGYSGMGFVLGADVPIVLNSRAASEEDKNKAIEFIMKRVIGEK